MSDEILHTHNPNNGVHKTNSISGPSGNSLNPRSCITCRRRKVKCDKKQPCSNCLRAKIDCIFPGPGRAPRKSKKPQDGELLDRLRRLEGVVQTLNAQVEEHEQEAAERDPPGVLGGCPDAAAPRKIVAEDNSVEGLENRFGRLVVDQGRSRYINNTFWASLNNEVEDLKSILVEDSDDDAEDNSPGIDYSHQAQGFIFGYSSTNVAMFSLHPRPEIARGYWAAYKENVDPLVKILHKPTFEPIFLEATTHLEKIPKGLECLMFAIYYGAVTSTVTDDCEKLWGEKRAVLVDRYRFGLEQALARANFLFCDEIIILQAFILFLMLLRRNDDARKIWTLTGLVVRIAQTLGIHRDGSHFGLPPFEVEMRRRLWWQLLILDARAAEDHGCDPTVVEAQFDTKMPLNVNDADLDPNMKELPQPRVGFTDITFSIIRFEVAHIFRRILHIPPGPAKCNEYFAGLTIQEKEKWISECHLQLEEKYLKDCDMTNPLCWVTATISRLVMSKMWLIVYHPHQRRDGGASLPQETKDKLFITSLENLEYSVLLETEARTMKWGWLFRTYVQWHAIAFLLSELCVRTKGEAVERAWHALEVTADRWWFPLSSQSSSRPSRQGFLWKPLRRLLEKARAARQRELALEKASQALRNGGLTYQNAFPTQLLGPGSTPPSILNQPSSQALDSMLRPAAPRLGDMPGAERPSWLGADGPPGPPSPAMREMREFFSTPESMSRPGGDSGEDFSDLLSNGLDNGLDYLVRNVMYNNDNSQNNSQDLSASSNPGTSTTSPSGNTRSFSEPSVLGRQDFTPPNLPAMDMNQFNVGQEMNSAFTNFQDSPSQLFANPSNTPPSIAYQNGQSSDSPVLDTAASVDWANWDDLVKQYGIDGVQPSNAGSELPNGAGHIAMMNWF